MEKTDRKLYLFALRIVGDFGAAIAIPVVAFVLGGQWLDTKYSTGNRYMIIGFVVAALLSGKIIYKKTKRYGKEYDDLQNPDKTE
jgi:hypothetical protein